MTLHIGLSTSAGSLLLSDSQGSTDTSATHGHQKQYVGEDFLVGCAGSGLIAAALFQSLSEREHAGSVLRAADVAGCVENFFCNEIRAGSAGNAELLLVTPPEPDTRSIQHFVPSLFTRIWRKMEMGWIGSGALFADHAARRDHALGIDLPRQGIADMLVMADEYAEAANESLTVNDKYVVGILSGGRSYVMGDASILPTYVPPQIRLQWDAGVSSRFMEIMEHVKAVRVTRRNIYRCCSAMLGGQSESDAQTGISEQMGALSVSMAMLKIRLGEYFNWYNTCLGRPTHKAKV